MKRKWTVTFSCTIDIPSSRKSGPTLKEALAYFKKHFNEAELNWDQQERIDPLGEDEEI